MIIFVIDWFSFCYRFYSHNRTIISIPSDDYRTISTLRLNSLLMIQSVDFFKKSVVFPTMFEPHCRQRQGAFG